MRRVDELTAAGRMRPAGVAEVAAAQADGRWAAAYASQRHATAPAELEAALERGPRARAVFERPGRTDRYLAMLGVLRARSPQQRTARAATVVARLEAAADGG
ncbi:YdeI family protein [Streptomyces sp. NPDC088766]|uniref:YdeI/OmpD-associated family protein n=1 Tax=Streptomyces sp. NPDC088766 TaxID=3365893 RepID=UPI0038176F54